MGAAFCSAFPCSRARVLSSRARAASSWGDSTNLVSRSDSAAICHTIRVLLERPLPWCWNCKNATLKYRPLAAAAVTAQREPRAASRQRQRQCTHGATRGSSSHSCVGYSPPRVLACAMAMAGAAADPAFEAHWKEYLGSLFAAAEVTHPVFAPPRPRPRTFTRGLGLESTATVGRSTKLSTTRLASPRTIRSWTKSLTMVSLPVVRCARMHGEEGPALQTLARRPRSREEEGWKAFGGVCDAPHVRLFI